MWIMKRVYLVCLNLIRKKFIITSVFGDILLYKTKTLVHQKIISILRWGLSKDNVSYSYTYQNKNEKPYLNINIIYSI